MYCNGVIVWSGTDGALGEMWDGYTVFQAKHKERLDAAPKRNAEWLWGQIRAELEAWADSQSGRGQVPNYLVFITNVPLSAVPDVGGLATVSRNIQAYLDGLQDSSRDVGEGRSRKAKLARMGRLKKWRIWDANQVDAYVTTHDSIRRAFSSFLTAADVFSNLAAYTDKLPLEQIETGLRLHARTALVGERSIYFDEAGAAQGEGTPIEEVAIDLPILTSGDGRSSTILTYVLDRGERVLRPRLKLHPGPRHLVVAGGPGNGKTTISKFLVQIYRAALLRGGHEVGAPQQAVIDGTTATLRAIGRGLPKNRRWPLRIDLAEYVEDRGLSEETLLRWIATKVSKRSNIGDVTPSALDSWLRQWPWLLVLDGLDEVTEPQTRKNLIERVTEFVSDAEADTCDLLVVLTTRPTGYVENIAPSLFERIDLAGLSPEQAVQYGVRATRVRLKNDTEKIERIERALAAAAQEESLKNLMRTPLQVLIMTIIVDGSGRISPDRYQLFWGYYETVFKRERAKRGSSAPLLEQHAQQILELHERVGFELQARSEASDGAAATLSRAEVEDLARGVLADGGFKPWDADARLLDSIVLAATNRLVLLAPRHDGLGFDVRSLQELMAARYLTTGEPAVVARRLAVAGPSPHWRNAWVFAAGRYFAESQPHLHELITGVVETIDRDAAHRLGRVCPIGPQLAWDLIDDGMLRSHPKYLERMIKHGLQLMSLPRPSDPRALARVILRAADIGDTPRALIADGLRDALARGGAPRRNTISLQDVMSSVADEARVASAAAALRSVRHATTAIPANEVDRDAAWASFDHTVTTLPDTAEARLVMAAAASSIKDLARAGSAFAQFDALDQALDDPETAQILELGIVEVAALEHVLVAGLRDQLVAHIHRASVGPLLGHDYVSETRN